MRSNKIKEIEWRRSSGAFFLSLLEIEKISIQNALCPHPAPCFAESWKNIWMNRKIFLLLRHKKQINIY